MLCSIPQKAADPLPESYVDVERGKFSQKYVVVDIVERLAKVQEDGVNTPYGQSRCCRVESNHDCVMSTRAQTVDRFFVKAC